MPTQIVAGILRMPSARPANRLHLSLAPTAPRAFTLVELLVVIAIIGMLVALVASAVQHSRESARKLQCSRNLGELGKSLTSYSSDKQKLPGYSQLVQRDNSTWVGGILNAAGRVEVENVDITNLNNAWDISWAAILLPNLDRQDIWDRLRNPLAAPSVPLPNREGTLEVRRLAMFVCPSDTEIATDPNFPALSYAANTGGWDRDGANFLGDDLPSERDRGDVAANGLLLNLAQPQRARIQPPAMRTTPNDGGATTILFSENCHKNYEPPNASTPLFTWLGGNGTDFGTEQQLGIVWVVNANPQPGNNLDDQQRINRADPSTTNYEPLLPRYARPASAHTGGVNVVFHDGHIEFVRDDMNYVTYQQLLTSDGAKCIDPQNRTAPNPDIQTFRNAPPLSDGDYL